MIPIGITTIINTAIVDTLSAKTQDNNMNTIIKILDARDAATRITDKKTAVGSSEIYSKNLSIIYSFLAQIIQSSSGIK